MTDPYRGPGGPSGAGPAGWGPAAPPVPSGQQYPPGPGPYQHPEQVMYPAPGPGGYPPPGVGPQAAPVGHPPASAPPGPAGQHGPAPAVQPTAAPSAPRRPSGSLDVGRTLALAVAALGVLNFIWGFLPAYSITLGSSVAVLTTAGAYASALLLIGGLVAAGAFLPGGRRHDYQAAVLSVVGAVGALATFLLAAPSLAVGAILLIIFGILQAVAAVGVLLLGRQSPGTGRGSVEPASPPAGPPAWSPAGPPVAPPGGGAPGSGSAPSAPAPQGWPSASAPTGTPGTPGASSGPAAPGPSGSPGLSDMPDQDAPTGPGWHGPQDVTDGDDPEATRIVRF